MLFFSDWLIICNIFTYMYICLSVYMYIYIYSPNYLSFIFRMDLPTRVKLVSCYYRSMCSPKAALRLYRNETGNRTPPCHETSVTRLIERFESTGSVADQMRSGRPCVSEKTVSDVQNSLLAIKQTHQLGVCSSADVHRHSGVPHSTVKKILRFSLQMRPYHVRRVQELKEADYQKRMQFANFFLDQCQHVDDYLSNVLWTDEAHFFLDGCVYTRNCVIWDTENPHATEISSLHPARVTVWAGFTATHILPPFFFDNTVDGDGYLTMLRDHVLPYLRNKRILRKTTFQQDGAPPHIKKCVTDFLSEQFKTKIISRCFDNAWPPRSPDLTPMDFWFWGALKRRVYGRCPTNLEQLKQFITEEMRAISADELRRSCESVATRLEALLGNNGGHIEQLLS